MSRVSKSKTMLWSRTECTAFIMVNAIMVMLSFTVSDMIFYQYWYARTTEKILTFVSAIPFLKCSSCISLFSPYFDWYKSSPCWLFGEWTSFITHAFDICADTFLLDFACFCLQDMTLDYCINMINPKNKMFIVTVIFPGKYLSCVIIYIIVCIFALLIVII